MSKINEVNYLGRKYKPNDGSKHATAIIDSSAKKRPIGITGNMTDDVFNNSSNIYLNPTEEMALKDIVREGSTVATVSGSGDFAIESIFHNAGKVCTFDINEYQYYVEALKVIAAQKLSYEDYFDFFSNAENTNRFMSTEIYEKIRQGLPTSRLTAFWDTMMKTKESELRRFHNLPFYQAVKEIKPDEPDFTLNIASRLVLQTIPSRVFNLMQGAQGLTIKGTYLEGEESYEQLKKALIEGKDISFSKCDLLKLKNYVLSNGLTKKYDLIYLSNIPDYIDGQTLMSTIDEQLMPLLNEGGEVAYCSQGADFAMLQSMNMNELIDMSKTLKIETALLGNTDVYKIMRANGIEQYALLTEKYDVDTIVSKTLYTGDGKGPDDIVVRIKK